MPALVSVFESVVLEVVWQQVFAPACMFVPVALEKLWQFHRSKGRLYRAVIGNRIAAVAFSLRRCKERHQMQVVDVALF